LLKQKNACLHVSHLDIPVSPLVYQEGTGTGTEVGCVIWQLKKTRQKVRFLKTEAKVKQNWELKSHHAWANKISIGQLESCQQQIKLYFQPMIVKQIFTVLLIKSKLFKKEQQKWMRVINDRKAIYTKRADTEIRFALF